MMQANQNAETSRICWYCETQCLFVYLLIKNWDKGSTKANWFRQLKNKKNSKIAKSNQSSAIGVYHEVNPYWLVHNASGEELEIADVRHTGRWVTKDALPYISMIKGNGTVSPENDPMDRTNQFHRQRVYWTQPRSSNWIGQVVKQAHAVHTLSQLQQKTEHKAKSNSQNTILIVSAVSLITTYRRIPALKSGDSSIKPQVEWSRCKVKRRSK